MSKGYVYIMTSSIEGLIKIGKSKDWNRRCQSELESNGYKNANGLKTYFVVEVDDQDEIEGTMHDVFRESRVSNFELFAIDKDRAKRVLSKMGKQVFPDTNTTNVNTTTTTTTTAEALYTSIWSRVNDIMSKRSDIKFNINTKVTKNCYNISNPVMGFWLHAWFSKTTNQFNIDFGTSNLTAYKSISKYNKILSDTLSFNVIYEKHPNYERIIHYENNVNINSLSDKDLNHFIDMIVEFYNAILTL